MRGLRVPTASDIALVKGDVAERLRARSFFDSQSEVDEFVTFAESCSITPNITSGDSPHAKRWVDAGLLESYAGTYLVTPSGTSEVWSFLGAWFWRGIDPLVDERVHKAN